MTTAGEATVQGVVVEVDVFSGVPNPTWSLDAESSARLAAIVPRLKPAADGTASPPSGLGFRGFVVRGLDVSSVSDQLTPHATLRVRGDGVVATAGDRLARFSDPGHELYTTLRDLALGHVSPEVASAIPTFGAR